MWARSGQAGPTGPSARRKTAGRAAFINVGLLGCLVVVRCRPRLQDPVGRLGCFPVGADSDPNPVSPGSRPTELADHAVVEWNGHASAHVVPLVALLRCQPELFDGGDRSTVAQVNPPLPTQSSISRWCTHCCLFRRTRCRDTPNGIRRDRLLPDRSGRDVIQLGRAYPEACDLNQQLCPAVDEILAVTGHLIVVPRVVGNRARPT